MTVQGDNDPVDVVEIGSSRLQMGGIYQVRPKPSHTCRPCPSLELTACTVVRATPL